MEGPLSMYKKSFICLAALTRRCGVISHDLSSSVSGLHSDFYNTADGHVDYRTNDDKNTADYQPRLNQMLRN